jgi:hypothetical protein
MRTEYDYVPIMVCILAIILLPLIAFSKADKGGETNDE